jgi:hypothetical protein
MSAVVLTYDCLGLGPHTARFLIQFSVSPASRLLVTELDLHSVSPSLVDVPMARVKFNVNTEYAYLQNFKVLQCTSKLFLFSQAQTSVDLIHTSHLYSP